MDAGLKKFFEFVMDIHEKQARKAILREFPSKTRSFVS